MPLESNRILFGELEERVEESMVTTTTTTTATQRKEKEGKGRQGKARHFKKEKTAVEKMGRHWYLLRCLSPSLVILCSLSFFLFAFSR